MYKNIGVLFLATVIQMSVSQCVRGPYSAPYPNEIAAANLVAESAALAGSAALIPYGPAAAIPYAPAYESVYATGVPGLTFGLTLAELAASNGGGLRVKSGSAVPVSGVSVETDSMIIEGPLAVSGQLPFLGVVSLEGPLPASGAGAVAYGCGNGNVGIVSEGVEPIAATYPGYPHAPGYPNGLAPGYTNALGYPANPGCAAVY